MLTVPEVKQLFKTGAKPGGQQFKNEKDSVGTVLAEASGRGKLQADMSCTEPGCTNLHRREVSDWHQCYRCVDHSKPSKAKVKDPAEKAKVDSARLASRQAQISSTQAKIKDLAAKYNVKVRVANG